MRSILTSLTLAGAVLAAGLPAAAGDAALILSNRDYEGGERVRDALDAFDLEAPLEQRGFAVTAARETTIDDARAAVWDFLRAHDGEGRMVMLLGGRFANRAGTVWWLSREAEKVNPITVGSVGLPVNALLDIAGRAPGEAVVLLATDDHEEEDGPSLRGGLRDLEIPQGVTLVTGPMDRLTGLLEDRILRPGEPLDAALDGVRGIEVAGFVSGAPFEPERDRDTGAPSGGSAEDGFWEAAQTLGTLEAFEAYQDAYPNGRYADEAAAEIRTIRDDPHREARLAEEALDMSLDLRRGIQRDLTLTGFDTYGIDGLFGPRTRAAISAWQRSIGAPETGYLTGNQVTRLLEAGDARRRELEEEARQRRAEEERRDKAYWGELNEGRDEAGLRAYLARYPDGVYADIARERLRVIEDQQRAEAEAEERAFWDSVVADDTIPAYRSYIQRYRDGAFAEAARARIDELNEESGQTAEMERARAEEERVIRNQVMRLLVEQQLSSLGLKVGQVDGTFDKQTRRAIRRYQRAHGIHVTGHVDRETATRMLSGR